MYPFQGTPEAPAILCGSDLKSAPEPPIGTRVHTKSKMSPGSNWQRFDRHSATLCPPGTLLTPRSLARSRPQIPMKRRSSAPKRSARETAAPGASAAASAGSGDAQESQGPQESQDAAPERRGPGTAAVTRERALYFATGQQQPSAKKPRSGNAAGAEAQERESWPGYFNTARDLSENREAAQAARSEEMQRREREAVSGERPQWKPRRAPRKAVLTRLAVVPRLQELALRCLARHIDVMPTLEYVDAGTRHRVARAVVELRKMKTEGVYACEASMGTPANVMHLNYSAPAVHVSRRDGDRHPRLLGHRRGDLRHGLEGVSRCRTPFVHPSTRSEWAMRVGQRHCRLGVRCNYAWLRCWPPISNRRGSLGLRDALKSVELLQVQGCYRLSDVGCEALVRRCAPSLQEFEISCNQRISKQSVDYFGELQHLQALTLSECPQLDDASLEALFDMKSLSKLALTQMERISDDFVEKLAGSLPGLREVSLARCTQLSDRAIRAVLEGCRDLKVLDISDMDELTDECLEPVRCDCTV